MDAKWEQLRNLLQLVALPVTGQVHFLADDCCRMEFLARALRAWRRELPVELATTLNLNQERVLAQLERHLADACRERTSPFWTDRAMRQSQGCRQARRMAREALLKFGWVLEVPPQEALYSLPARC